LQGSKRYINESTLDETANGFMLVTSVLKSKNGAIAGVRVPVSELVGVEVGREVPPHKSLWEEKFNPSLA
jgi:hypothetical protein